MADKVDAYFRAFKKYYRDIFWPQMDITQDEVDGILGIDNRRNRDANFAKELNQFRQGVMQNYIQRRESEGTFFNLDGESVILVNKRLVFLSRGAGFGELALLTGV